MRRWPAHLYRIGMILNRFCMTLECLLHWNLQSLVKMLRDHVLLDDWSGLSQNLFRSLVVYNHWTNCSFWLTVAYPNRNFISLLKKSDSIFNGNHGYSRKTLIMNGRSVSIWQNKCWRRFLQILVKFSDRGVLVFSEYGLSLLEVRWVWQKSTWLHYIL